MGEIDVEYARRAADRLPVLDAIEPVALAYPHGPAPLDHDDDCAFAYGNTTYACRCFVRLSEVRAALAPGGAAVSTRCGAPAIGGACVLAQGHNMGRADIPENHRAASE